MQKRTQDSLNLNRILEFHTSFLKRNTHVVFLPASFRKYLSLKRRARLNSALGDKLQRSGRTVRGGPGGAQLARSVDKRQRDMTMHANMHQQMHVCMQ